MLDRYGPPPLWQRPASFRSLIHIVNEQKISLASARAIADRVAALCVPFTPANFLAIPHDGLRASGMSAAKIGYARSIATALQRRTLVLDKLARMPDEQVVAALVAVHGVGPWTAGVYLSMALGRPDAWPPGDRALALGAAEMFDLPDVPTYPALDALAERWRPYRGAASRLVWHSYLCRRNRTAP